MWPLKMGTLINAIGNNFALCICLRFGIFTGRFCLWAASLSGVRDGYGKLMVHGWLWEQQVSYSQATDQPKKKSNVGTCWKKWGLVFLILED